ncbi:SSF1 protein, partial [Corythaixoides concolor]|nr:SSF1 protein [Corythaixoides concolor]
GSSPHRGLRPAPPPAPSRSPQSKNQKKERAAALQNSQQEYGTVPHSFVFHRGRVGKNVRRLAADVRKVMEPFTARALKV